MLGNSILLALREIRRNLLRSALAILGLIIGVASVGIVVAVGDGTAEVVSAQIASLGKNLLIITPAEPADGKQSKTVKPFHYSDLQLIARTVPGLRAIAPVESSKELAVLGSKNLSVRLIGSNNAYFAVANKNLQSGRFFTENEIEFGSNTCVLAETTRDKLFGRQSPLGQKIRIGRNICSIVGVFSGQGMTAIGSLADDEVVVPLFGFQRRVSGNKNVGLIEVLVDENRDLDSVKRQVMAVLRKKRQLQDDEANDFSIMDMREIENIVSSTSSSLSNQLIAVAAISLLVGGIGIMNIMVVSVTERTKEIGTKMAIGALPSHILSQFLVEATALSVVGGGLGVLTAAIAAPWVANLLSIPLVFDEKIVLLSLVCSAFIGIAFGIFPAHRAAMLNPIDALRHE